MAQEFFFFFFFTGSPWDFEKQWEIFGGGKMLFELAKWLSRVYCVANFPTLITGKIFTFLTFCFPSFLFLFFILFYFCLAFFFSPSLHSPNPLMTLNFHLRHFPKCALSLCASPFLFPFLVLLFLSPSSPDNNIIH